MANCNEMGPELKMDAGLCPDYSLLAAENYSVF